LTEHLTFCQTKVGDPLRGLPAPVMQQSTVYCPVHGLFSPKAVINHSCINHSCPKCGRPGEPVPSSFARLQDRLEVLLDPQLSVKALLSLRQLASAAQAELLTPEEVARGVAHLALPCGDLFTVRVPNAPHYGELAEALGAILKARFTGGADFREDEEMGVQAGLQGELIVNDENFDIVLADAGQEIDSAHRLVCAQEAKIRSMRAAGLNTHDAEDLLAAYRYGAQLATDHRDALSRKRGK
jgi:hypothetical protein